MFLKILKIIIILRDLWNKQIFWKKINNPTEVQKNFILSINDFSLEDINTFDKFVHFLNNYSE